MAEATYRRPPTAQQAALEELRRWLLSGRLMPGDQVVQEVVASELGISIVPIREALKTLQTEGLLRYRPHRGFFVTELSREELIELCDIRSVLEALAVARGLEGLSQDDVETMRDLLGQMDVADRDGNILSLIRLDREFHFTVFRAAKMPHLERVITLTWDQSDPYRAAFFADLDNRGRNRAEHNEIFAAVERRDTEGLIELLNEHRLGPTRRIPQLTEPTG